MGFVWWRGRGGGGEVKGGGQEGRRRSERESDGWQRSVGATE